MKIVVIIPAYNAAKTLTNVWNEIPHKIVDDVILVDDASEDETCQIARKLGIQRIISHERNLGYGANQKTCYDEALRLNADIIVMVHGDFQYTPKLVHAMAALIAEDEFAVVFGSRMLGKGAAGGKMPAHRYWANRILTFIQNFLIAENLSEYHTGLRAFRSDVLLNLDYHKYSDSFLFDNQIILDIVSHGIRIGEISCPTRYAPDSSSINLIHGFSYGMQVLWLSIRYFFQRGYRVKATRINDSGAALWRQKAAKKKHRQRGPA